MGDYVQSALGTMVYSYLERDCVLTDRQLKRLGEHKYSSLDVSWLDELIMKR